jgi:hypothetical protein
MKRLTTRLLLLIFFVFLDFIGTAQSLDADTYIINIFSTNGFIEEDKISFLKYISESTKLSKKSLLVVNIISPYNSVGYFRKEILSLDRSDIKLIRSSKKFTSEKWNRTNLLDINSELNRKFKESVQLISEFQNKRLNQNIDLLIYSDVSTFLVNNLKPIAKNRVNEIAKAIGDEWNTDKLEKEPREINIFYDKGVKEYVFSVERMTRCYEEYQNGNLYRMRPEFLNIEEYTQLRPQGSVGNDNPYTIRFDSVGYFDSYELAIFRSGTDEVLFKERIEFSSDNSYFQLNYTGDGRVCEIRIMAKHLGMLCYGNFPDQNLNTAPDVTDCGPCSLECLYKKSWDIQIRGCVEGVSKDKLWTEKIKRVEFQCPKKSS